MEIEGREAQTLKGLLVGSPQLTGLGNVRRQCLGETSWFYLSDNDSAVLQLSARGGDTARAPFQKPKSMISGPQERSSLVHMSEVGLLKGPESRPGEKK